MPAKERVRRLPGLPNVPSWSRRAHHLNRSSCMMILRSPTPHLAHLGAQVLQVRVLAPNRGRQTKAEVAFRWHRRLPLGLLCLQHRTRPQIQSTGQFNIPHLRTHIPARTRPLIHLHRSPARSPQRRLLIGRLIIPHNLLTFNTMFKLMCLHLLRQTGTPQEPPHPNNINSSHRHHLQHQSANTLIQVRCLSAMLYLAKLAGMHMTLRLHMARLMGARLRCTRSPQAT